MRRIVVRKPGGYGALETVEELEPEPGVGEVRVRVGAAGVNYADCVVRMGLYEAARGLYPLTPGFEFSGVVERRGPMCASPLLEGERVFGITRFGGYASSACVPESALWRVPDGWDLAQAAAFPAAHLTAWHGLFQVAKVEPAETLLVHSAAGGVGQALCRLGRLGGCRVVGVVGAAAKAAAARAAGAEAVVDKAAGPPWARLSELCPDGFDAVFDADGGPGLLEGFGRLKPGGRLVCYGFAAMLPRGRGRPSWPKLAYEWLRRPRFDPLRMTGSNKSVCGFNVVYLFHRLELARRAMDRMLLWAVEGKLPPPSVARYPLAEAGRAHRDLESGETTGKLVLVL